MAWKKGKSGNPGGRPTIPTCVRDMARAESKPSIGTLVEIRDDKTAPASARVLAANSLLDRAWGKPLQSSVVAISGDEKRDATDWTREELVAFLNEAGKRGDATPEHIRDEDGPEPKGGKQRPDGLVH